jgi:hypothetical protein
MAASGPAPASRGFEGAGRHHRRVRRVSGPRPFRHTPLLLVATGVALLTMVGGYALGSFVLGGFGSAPAQSAASGAPSAPPGVTYVEVLAMPVNSSTTPATGGCNASNLGNATHPTNLTNGTSTAICLSHSATGFAAGDTMYVLEVSWNATALNSTVFKIQVSIDVSPSTNDISVTAYLRTSATISTSEQAVFALDMIQAGDTAVTGYSMLTTQL